LQVVEHGLGHLPFIKKQVITPIGIVFTIGIVAMMAMAKKSFHLFMIFLGFRVYG
jgi:ATP/ADP translocase